MDLLTWLGPFLKEFGLPVVLAGWFMWENRRFRDKADETNQRREQKMEDLLAEREKFIREGYRETITEVASRIADHTVAEGRTADNLAQIYQVLNIYANALPSTGDDGDSDDDTVRDILETIRERRNDAAPWEEIALAIARTLRKRNRRAVSPATASTVVSPRARMRPKSSPENH